MMLDNVFFSQRLLTFFSITYLHLCAPINFHHLKTSVMNSVPLKQRFIILNDDLDRHQWMIRFHAIDGFLFLIRFVILCTDLSAASNAAIELQSTIKSFLAFILLFELVGGLSVLLANILYSCMVYAGRILYETDADDIPYCPRKPLLRLSTFTCFTCDCYYEHPHTVLLTRVAILSLCLFFRFVGFILGATCASHYPPRAIAYTVFAALSLPPSIVTMVLEYYHHRRLWHYFPDDDALTQRSPKHLQFLPYSIINDQRTSSWHSSSCKRPRPCLSRNLYHILLYHTGSTRYGDDAQIMIGFHQTNQAGAFGISKTGFRISDDGMLGPGVYFATCFEHTEFKANHRGAYICARVNVGNVIKTTSRNPAVNAAIACDTLYFDHRQHGSDEFCVRNSDRIEQWIIVVNQDDSIRRAAAGGRDDIKDHFYGETYTGCIY